MLVFPNAKVNLGLHVVAKRPDGFHDIETVFYPLSWCEALEAVIVEHPGKTEKLHPFELQTTGLPVYGQATSNLVYKAWSLMQEKYTLPPLKAHLHKVLPMGAGMGGGSADAAYFINLVNTLLELNIPVTERKEIAAKVGSDCTFFIENKPAYAFGKGDELIPVSVDLSQYYFAVVFPGIHSNTRLAYEGVKPSKPAYNLKEIVQLPPETWNDVLKNDFEEHIFRKHPRIAEIKKTLYNTGAVYSSMSGSGSAVFGIFKEPPSVIPVLPHEQVWIESRL